MRKPPEPEEILALYRQRKAAEDPNLQRMREIQAVMNNDVVLPLTELESGEEAAVANLASQGMDQMARRIASVDPTNIFPPLRPKIEKSREQARDRLRIVNSWQYENDMRILRGRRGRQFLAYACAPVVLKPNREKGIPCWYVRNPLWTFPAECEFNDYLPRDCIFVQQHTYGWLESRYPEQMAAIQKPFNWNGAEPNMEAVFDCLEYLSDDWCCLTVIAPESDERFSPWHSSYGTDAEHLVPPVPNLAGMPLTVVPGSISLDKQKGHFDGIIGMYQAQAALMAISLIAQRRSVWPREWAVSNPGEQVEVVTVPNPAAGIPGQLRGGKIETQTLDPSFHADALQDRLEYAQRMTASLPAEFGGMSPTNVRTGARGAQVMGTAIDFTISEAQDVFAKTMRHENEVAMAIDCGYFNTKKTYFIMTRGFAGTVDYKPDELWMKTKEVDFRKHLVEYPINGVDLQNLPVEGGQRVAMNTMSRRRFMEIDPVIPDALAEEQQIVREGVAAAFLSSIQTMAAMPEGPWQPIHLARLDKKLTEGKDLYTAVMELQEEVQGEQAQVPEDPAMTQPGLSMPGQGVEQASIEEPTVSMQNMSALLGQLGRTQQAQTSRT